MGYSVNSLVWVQLSHDCHHVWNVGKGPVKNYGTNERRNFVVTKEYVHGAENSFLATARYLMVQIMNQLEVINDHEFEWFTLHQLPLFIYF